MRIERSSDLLRRGLGPLRPAAERAYRALATQVPPRLARAALRGRGDPRAPALSDAVRAVSGDDLAPEESAWVSRIEAARMELAGSELERAALNWGVPEPWGRFLLRLARQRGGSCLELGTGVGISSAYISAGLELAQRGRLLTIERREPRARGARDLLAGLGLDRADVRIGDFEQVLGGVLEEAAPLDLVFIDSFKDPGHVVWCFERLRGRLGPDGLVVLDDIHWARRMARTWRALRRDPRWALSVDLWRLGVLAESRPAPGTPESRPGDPVRAYDPPP